MVMEYLFDRRSLTRSFCYEWQDGSCNVRFQADSTAVDGFPNHLSHYTLDLEAASWCDVLRSPHNIFVGLRPGPSTTDHWHEDLPAAADILAFVESSDSWLQLRGRLAQFLPMPAEVLETIQLRLLPLIQDAILKARLLEHCTLWICVIAKVTTESFCENEEDIRRESSMGLITGQVLEARAAEASYSAAAGGVDSISNSDGLQTFEVEFDVDVDDAINAGWYEFPPTSGASKKAIEKYLKVSAEDPKDEGIAINDGLCAICQSRIWEDPSVPAAAVASTSSGGGAGEAGVAGTLPCGHVFHRKCITKWLEVRKICPLCKVGLPEVDEEEEED